LSGSADDASYPNTASIAIVLATPGELVFRAMQIQDLAQLYENEDPRRARPVGGGFGTVAQRSSASFEGSLAITGTATFHSSCFSSGTIMSGTFSSGSFIIGTSVALVIETGSGTVAFLGTENLDKGEISGKYTVVGGTCDQTGTGVLITSSPWDY
jgi:hypothetical protein